MKKRKAKKRFKIMLLLIDILLLLGVVGYIALEKINNMNYYNAYLASYGDNIILYDDTYNKSLDLVRGTKVLVTDKIYTNNDIEYHKIKYDNHEYYVLKDDVVGDYKYVIKEDVMYVKTPVTVYKDINDASILGFLDKGSSVQILGFDNLTNGIPNMYKISYGDEIGYVYSKYLVSDHDTSLLNSDFYDIHKDRKFSYELYGGHASELDYYPYEKANFTSNVMPDEVKALYINASMITNTAEYLSIAKESGINAFVIDIYDGYLAYKSEVAKEYGDSLYASAKWSIDEYKSLIDIYKNNGYYVIGRIVAFNNPHFAKDNENDAITYNGKSLNWVSAYSRRAWEYNVKLAIEAVNLFGFNEIQYDYIRFPEASYTWSKNKKYDFKNTYNESKGEAIQNFLFYATDMIHREGAYISADVFGESAYTYVTAYGQYFPAISNIVDVISAMPYPDHFNKYDFNFKVPVWTKPYELMLKWSSYPKERQTEIPTPAKVRTWIQAYDTIHEPYVKYGSKEVEDQISALYEMGLNDGYITWNAGSNIIKYRSIIDALKKDYR